ncbi:MAG TPA: LTA synthase family protein [Candidatus Competibacteraceae bacterium]|nr:LTA synthase family protein [Candidatus Competibacteraceae bacterium]
MSRARLSIRWLPLLSTPLYYALYYAVGHWAFAVTVEPRALPYDLALQVLLGYLLYALSRHAWPFLLLQGLLMGLLYIGNAIKISVFGGPIVPDDIYALRALLLILEGWQFAIVVALLIGLVGLLLGNLSLRRSGGWALAALGLWVAALIYYPSVILNPLDRWFGNVVWSQRINYLNRGATLYSLQELARHLATVAPVPDRRRALAAADALLANAAAQPVRRRAAQSRNVHLILLETFWDPSPLTAAAFDRDPLHPEFRRLWQAAGYSTVLSPVFGGYTANAEFEALCGFPVEDDSIKFEHRLSNTVPCLPRILAEQGYRTVASHPNVPVFWNRIHAYPRIGFQRSWFQEHFELDDMNGDFLSDRSLYRQVLTRLDTLPEPERPLFNYIVTIFGHLDYPLNAVRPALVSSHSAVPEVGAYANTVYYKSAEFVELVEALHRRDPDALIIAFGDHLPFLGGNFAGYVESGLLSAKQSEFDAQMYRFHLSTPLLVLDGRRGPRRVGTLPLYRLPALILELLGQRPPPMLAFSAPPPGLQVRPLPGLHLNLLADGATELCLGGPAEPFGCWRSTPWLEQLRLVSDDLFRGRQYALRVAPAAEPAAEEPATLANLEEDGMEELPLESDTVIAN